MIDFKRKENETENQYLWRVGVAIENGTAGITWDEAAPLINKEWREDESEYRTSSAYRKPVQYALRFMEDGVFSGKQNGLSEELIEQKYELAKERMRLRDERRAINERLRSAARLDHRLDYLGELIEANGHNAFGNIAAPNSSTGENDIVVMLADLHIGASYYNFNGTYDPEIAKGRLMEYLAEVGKIKETHNPKNCHIVILGDCISGNIHKNLTVTNSENVVRQIQLMCDYVSEFCGKVGELFGRTGGLVTIHCVTGNHTRLDKKEDAIHDERLDDLLPWYLERFFGKVKNVAVLPGGRLDSGIDQFSVRGIGYVAVHGDFDGFNDAGISKLSMFLGYKPNIVLYGHKHFPAMTECSDVVMVQSGSLCGSGDQFTLEHRMLSKPAQSVLVVDSSGIVAHYPVKLHDKMWFAGAEEGDVL